MPGPHDSRGKKVNEVKRYDVFGSHSACHTNNCPVGIATQQPHLRRRLKIEMGAKQLDNFFRASTELMQVMARACGHDHLKKFCIDDLSVFDRDIAHLTGIAYAGVSLE